MDYKMSYIEGISFMKRLCSNRDRNGAKSVFIPESKVFPELKIVYPGRKQDGDYRLELSGSNNPPCHTDICELLHNLIKNKACNYSELVSLLDDIYNNGTNINIQKYSYSDTERLVALIYWITLQDEINYPQPRYQGRRMPFCRYFEAVYCAENDDFTLADVFDRCNNSGYVPSLYNISSSPSFYY